MRLTNIIPDLGKSIDINTCEKMMKTQLEASTCQNNYK